MKHKTLPVSGIKTAGLGEGEFEGFASCFDNVDSAGDVVRKGAFAKSIKAGSVTPLIWEHLASDPRNYVGEVVEARETDEGLAIKGRFDLDTEHGAAAYRAVKGRRVSGLSIGYMVRNSTKNAEGATELLDLDLLEVSVVARGANDRALVTNVKSQSDPDASRKARAAYARLRVDMLTKSDTAPGGTIMSGATSIRMQKLVKAKEDQLEYIDEIMKNAGKLRRELTEDESAEVVEATEEVKKLDQRITAYKAEQDGFNEAMDLARRIGGAPGGDGDGDGTKPAGKLALMGAGGKASAATMVKSMPTTERGSKALTSGKVTSTVLDATVYETGRPPTSLLDVLPVRTVSPNYSFIRQTTRTLNAAPVATGALKPESIVGTTTVDAKLEVIAHLSEPIPEYTLSDNSALEQFVADELLWGLNRALENQVLNGTGVSPQLSGVLGTSGLQVQAFATNSLTSIRKGITKLEATGYAAGVLVISADDWEAIELLTATTGATDVQGVPVDAVARKLWGVQAVISTVLPAKTALLIDPSALAVDTDGEISTKWSDAVDDDFGRNQVRGRVEGRFGVSVFRPGAIVKVATAAA